MHLEERVARLRPVHNAAGNQPADPPNEGRLADLVLVEHLVAPVLGLRLAGLRLAGLVPKGRLAAPRDQI
jgi:hypothetical protein